MMVLKRSLFVGAALVAAASLASPAAMAAATAPNAVAAHPAKVHNITPDRRTIVPDKAYGPLTPDKVHN